MKSKNNLSLIDGILSLAFLLLCPVVAISIYDWDFSFPVWGYILFVVASYRMYQLYGQGHGSSKMQGKTYDAGDEVETSIVGVTFENRQERIKKMKIGQTVLLIREPDNPHDGNAIKVVTHRYSEDEREEVEPILKERYGRFSTEIIKELFAYDDIGYISRELAKKISPIFDKHAVKPNQYIPASVIKITSSNDAESMSQGVKIRFKLPTLMDLRIAMQKEMDFDMEMDAKTHLPL